MTILFSDKDYEIQTALDVNNFEHAKNLVDIAFAALQVFKDQQGLTKEEALARSAQLKEKFNSTLVEFDGNQK